MRPLIPGIVLVCTLVFGVAPTSSACDLRDWPPPAEVWTEYWRNGAANFVARYNRGDRELNFDAIVEITIADVFPLGTYATTYGIVGLVDRVWIGNLFGDDELSIKVAPGSCAIPGIKNIRAGNKILVFLRKIDDEPGNTRRYERLGFDFEIGSQAAIAIKTELEKLKR